MHAAPRAQPPSQLQQQLWKPVLQQRPALFLTPAWRTLFLQLPSCDAWYELRGQEQVGFTQIQGSSGFSCPIHLLASARALISGKVEVAPAPSTHPEVHLNPSA